jgi:hypothetical protein
VVDTSGQQIYEQLLALDYLFRFHLQQYLTVKGRFNLARETEIQEVTASLRQVLSQIIALVPRMESFQRVMHFAMNNFIPRPWVPHPRRRLPSMQFNVNNQEQDCILLFGLATVIEGMINQSDIGTHPNDNSNISPAHLLCRLRVLLREGRWSFGVEEARFYFWAALQLVNDVDIAGNHSRWIHSTTNDLARIWAKEQLIRILDYWIKSIGVHSAIVEMLLNALKITPTFPSSRCFPFWTAEGIDIVQCNRVVEMMSACVC